jgi:predicted phage terminase large subunit-like protein
MPGVTQAEAQAARFAVDAAIARKSFLEFCPLVYPGFVAAPHLVLLAELLERVERGELRRIIVSLHPGSGKSTLLQLFQSWYLGRDPKRRIISTSAAQRLVVRNSRAVRDALREPSWPFEAKLAPEATAADVWETTAGGGMFAVGVEGVVTGWRAPLIVCDDLQDGPGSKLERDNLEQWFRGKLLPRLEPNGAVVIVQTRWSKDDLPGRVMDGARGKAWHYVRIPALSEGEGDPLGRPEGEALWPGRFNVEALEEIRADSGPKHFAAQYQGAPVIDGGEVFRTEWFGRYHAIDLPRDPNTGGLKMTRIVCALDAASKTGVRNDYSVVLALGEHSGKFYVLDLRRARVEYPELKRMVLSAHDRWRPSHFYVEDTANATALIQQLKSESHLPIIPVKVTASKDARAEAVSGIVESGRIMLPYDAPWLADFEDEVCSFPSGDHDDIVDAFTMVLSQAVKKPFSFIFSFGADDVVDDLTINSSAEETAEYKQAWKEREREEKEREREEAANLGGLVVPPDFTGGVGNALKRIL